MEKDEKHEQSNYYYVNIYIGAEKKSNNLIITKHGSADDMYELFNYIKDGDISDVIMAEIAANHIDMDPGWEHDDYVVEMTDPDGNEECSAKVKVE